MPSTNDSKNSDDEKDLAMRMKTPTTPNPTGAKLHDTLFAVRRSVRYHRHRERFFVLEKDLLNAGSAPLAKDLLKLADAATGHRGRGAACTPRARRDLPRRADYRAGRGLIAPKQPDEMATPLAASVRCRSPPAPNAHQLTEKIDRTAKGLEIDFQPVEAAGALPAGA